MREERKFKASHFENIQELIASCIIWIKTDDYDAYCRFFDMGAMEELIKELNNLKEIEKSHQEENGKLRVELEQEKEKNKYYEERIVNQMCSEEFKKLHEEIFKTVKNDYISKDKIKEIVDEHIPKQPNIITGEIEYTPNTNANSFLVQDILELLEEK